MTTEPAARPATQPTTSSGWPPAESVVADGHRFALHRLGPADSTSEPAVLLLHEPGRSADRWKSIAAGLAADRQVLAPDLPGDGHTEAGPRTLSATVLSLIGLVLHDSDREVDLVGTGAGGTLAIAMAAARPDLVRRLVVVGGGWPAGLPTGPGEPSRDHAAAAAVLGRVAALNGDGHWKTQPIPASWELPSPERSLIIWGARDRVLLPRHGERVLSALGRCVDPATVTMATFPGTGHRVLDEASGDVTTLLREFLRTP